MKVTRPSVQPPAGVERKAPYTRRPSEMQGFWVAQGLSECLGLDRALDQFGEPHRELDALADLLGAPRRARGFAGLFQSRRARTSMFSLSSLCRNAGSVRARTSSLSDTGVNLLMTRRLATVAHRPRSVGWGRLATRGCQFLTGPGSLDTTWNAVSFATFAGEAYDGRVCLSGTRQSGGRHGQGFGRRLSPARQVFDEVDAALGERLSDTIWNGPAETLMLTENAQPALMAVSLATMRVLEAEAGVDLGRDAAFVAGHSLGEYSALAAAGAISISDAARLLRIRGRAMQKAVPVGAGAMAALIGLDYGAVKAIAAEAAGAGVCAAANDNGGDQVVLSGNKAAVERAVDLAKARGAKRAMLLPVSAPFHCALMQPAAEAMAEALAKVSVKRPQVPLIANVWRRRYGARRYRALPGRTGHRNGAVARVGCLHGKQRSDGVLRSWRRQGAHRLDQADRACGDRVCDRRP